MIEPKPVLLTGSRVQLEPLSAEHLDGLVSLYDPQIWRHYSHPPGSTEGLRSGLKKLLADQAELKTLIIAPEWADVRAGLMRNLNR